MDPYGDFGSCGGCFGDYYTNRPDLQGPPSPGMQAAGRVMVTGVVVGANVAAWAFTGPFGGVPVTVFTGTVGGATSYYGRQAQYVDYAGQPMPVGISVVAVAGDITGVSAGYALVMGQDALIGTPLAAGERVEIGAHLGVGLAAGVGVGRAVGKTGSSTVARTSTAIPSRMEPGVAHGAGKPIVGTWLKGTDGNAGFVPAHIAAKLRGKEFKDFRHFRETFWKEVASDPLISEQFGRANIARMQKGYAPRVSSSQAVGGQKSYILHHRSPIQHGGGMYNMDNLMVVTPRLHREILYPPYHY